MGEEYCVSKRRKLPSKVRSKKSTKLLVAESALAKLWTRKVEGGENDVEMTEVAQ